MKQARYFLLPCCLFTSATVRFQSAVVYGSTGSENGMSCELRFVGLIFDGVGGGPLKLELLRLWNDRGRADGPGKQTLLRLEDALDGL